MSLLNVIVLDLLNEKSRLDDFDIFMEMRQRVEDFNLETEEIKAEILAYSFRIKNDLHLTSEPYIDELFWKYSEEGEVLYLLRANEVSTELVEQWNNKVYELVNKQIKLRFIDLVCHFADLTEFKCNLKYLSELYYETLCDVIEDNGYDFLRDIIPKSRRAIYLKKRVSKKPNLERLFKLITKCESEFGKDDSKLGLYGHAYNLFIGENGNLLTEDQENIVIDQLLIRFDRIREKPELEEFRSIEYVTSKLADYYKMKGKRQELELLLEKVEEYVLSYVHINHIQLPDQIETVHKFYKKYKFNEASKRVLKLLKEKSGAVIKLAGMQSFEFEVSNKDLDDYYQFFNRESIDETLHAIALYHIPILEGIKERLNENRMKYPLSSLFGKAKVDESGVRIASVGSLESDPEGNLVWTCTRDIELLSYKMRYLFDRLIYENKLNCIVLHDFVCDSPLFEEERHLIVKKALEFYFENDWISFIHIIIPQVERAILILVELLGGSVIEEAKNDGYKYNSLGVLINSNELAEYLSEDMILYLKTLLVDNRGRNIRNRVCHGVADQNDFSSTIADRIMHLLLFFGMFRESYLYDM